MSDDGMNDLREWLAAGLKRLAEIRATLPPTPAPSREAPRWDAWDGQPSGLFKCSKCDTARWPEDRLQHQRECWNAAPSQPARAETERIYPCDKCGKLRSKDEGGTTFSVCDECWNAGVAAMTGKTSPARASAEPRWVDDGRLLPRCSECGVRELRAIDRAAHQDECWPSRSPAAPRGEARDGGARVLKCDCGKPAVCIGNGEGNEGAWPACNDCCGHGNEDGWCVMLGSPEFYSAILQGRRSRASSAPGAGVEEWTDARLAFASTALAYFGSQDPTGTFLVDPGLYKPYADALQRLRAAHRSLARAKQEHAEPQGDASVSPTGSEQVDRSVSIGESPSPGAEDAHTRHSTPAPPAEMAACSECGKSPDFDKGDCYVECVTEGCVFARRLSAMSLADWNALMSRRAPAARDEYARAAIELAEADIGTTSLCDSDVAAALQVAPTAAMRRYWLALRDFRKARAASTKEAT